jgi:hypothetical protein
VCKAKVPEKGSKAKLGPGSRDGARKTGGSAKCGCLTHYRVTIYADKVTLRLYNEGHVNAAGKVCHRYGSTAPDRTVTTKPRHNVSTRITPSCMQYLEQCIVAGLGDEEIKKRNKQRTLDYFLHHAQERTSIKLAETHLSTTNRDYQVSAQDLRNIRQRLEGAVHPDNAVALHLWQETNADKVRHALHAVAHPAWCRCAQLRASCVH